MVLSSKVAESDSSKSNQAEALVPPGGLNRRVANLSPAEFQKHQYKIQKRIEKKMAKKRLPIEVEGLDGKVTIIGDVPKAEKGRKKREKLGSETSDGERTFKHLRMQQALSTVGKTKRAQLYDEVKRDVKFEDFQLFPQIVNAVKTDALNGLEYQDPTPVQKIVIPTLLKNGRMIRDGKAKGLQTFLIAAETGSGKTLSYILPLLEEIKRDEAEEIAAEAEKKRIDEESRKGTPQEGLEIPVPYKEDPRVGHPRAVILVPTVELVEQVYQTLHSLSYITKFRSARIHREITPQVLRKKLYHSPIDIIVATPQLLESMTGNESETLSMTKHIVVDEADSLLDRSFSPVTSAIIERAKSLQRLILCSATIPKSLDTRLREDYPDITRLVTPNLHVIPRRVQLSIVDVDGELYKGNRMLACADTLYTLAKEPSEPGQLKRVIVFVNERGTPKEVAVYLQSKDIDAIALDRDTSERDNREILEIFTGDKVDVEEGKEGRRRMKVLVTTDILSRGVDTKTVKNVILYDVPHSTIDFIHRVGRVGRLGRRGRAWILVDKATNKGWVKDLKE